MTVIAPLQSADRSRWEELARGYKAFYRTHTPDEAFDETWRRLLDEGSGFHGLGAYVNGELIGITHYLFHPMFWYGDTCYLQDLFVAEKSRGHGAARAMIEEVAERTRAAGATRLYWTTQEDNLRARVLYDKVARYNGFIKYDYPLLTLLRPPVRPHARTFPHKTVSGDPFQKILDRWVRISRTQRSKIF